MKKFVCILALISTTLLFAQVAFAQQPTRFEAGPILSCFSDCTNQPLWAWGVRGTVNVTGYLAGEAQIYRRQPQFSSAAVVTTFNTKVTLRREYRYKFNLFAVAGPGFASRENLVLFDLGGGGEFVPVRNFAFRVDVTHFFGAWTVKAGFMLRFP